MDPQENVPAPAVSDPDRLALTIVPTAESPEEVVPLQTIAASEAENVPAASVDLPPPAVDQPGEGDERENLD